jgi:hypothetical protein
MLMCREGGKGVYMFQEVDWDAIGKIQAEMQRA